MDPDLKAGIDALYKRLNPLMEKEKMYKKLINEMSVEAGAPAPFPDVDSMSSAGVTNILPDQFFGKPLFTAVKEYLKMKGRAAPAREIFDALKQGGYEFTGAEKLQYRGFTISLSKYGGKLIYVKPSDSWGLPEFYPSYVAKKKAAAASGGAAAPAAAEGEENEEPEKDEEEEADSTENDVEDEEA